MTKKIIQIAGLAGNGEYDSSNLYALCDDGTVWVWTYGKRKRRSGALAKLDEPKVYEQLPGWKQISDSSMSQTLVDALQG